MLQVCLGVIPHRIKARQLTSQKVLSVDDPCDESTWTTFWVKIWRGASVNLRGQEALEYIHDKTVPLRDIFQAAIEWTPDDSYVSVNEMKTWVPVAWDNYGGRVTLAGDAAHPMLLCKFAPAMQCRTATIFFLVAFARSHGNRKQTADRASRML